MTSLNSLAPRSELGTGSCVVAESGIQCRRVFAVGRVQQMGRMIRSTESNACGIRPPLSEELGSPRFDFDSLDDAQADRECVVAAAAMRR